MSLKAKTKSRLPVLIWGAGVGGALLAAGTLIDRSRPAVSGYVAPVASASPVISNPTPAAPLQTQEQQSQPDPLDVFQPAEAPELPQVPRVFQYGFIQLHPHFAYRWSYASGLQSAPGAGQTTVLQAFSPGITVDFGSHWTFDYTPTFSFYSDSHFRNTVDHSLSLAGGFEFNAWKFGVSHGMEISSEPLVETGRQTDQTTHNTELTASRMLTAHVSADLSLSQGIALVGGYNDSYSWSTLDWVTYHFGPRLLVGLGGGGGYVLVHGGAATGGTNNLNQSYEQLEARIGWRPTDKLSLQLNGGAEDRQFMMAGRGDSVNPIFGLTLEYLPFQATEIAVNASRMVSSSDYYLAAQEMDVTSVGVSLSQQLVRQFQLGASVTYSQIAYGVSIGGANVAAANRSDDVLSFSVNLSHPFYRRGTWSMFYQYSDDQSSQAGYGFQSSLMGFDINYGF